MINDTVEEEMSDATIRQRLQKWGGASAVEGVEDFAAIANLFRAFLDLSENDREQFLNGVDAFVCGSCGRPSCLCGYSDD